MKRSNPIEPSSEAVMFEIGPVPLREGNWEELEERYFLPQREGQKEFVVVWVIGRPGVDEE